MAIVYSLHLSESLKGSVSHLFLRLFKMYLRNQCRENTEIVLTVWFRKMPVLQL